MSNEEKILTDQPAENSFGRNNVPDSEMGVANNKEDIDKEDIEHSLKCQSFCCSQILAERLTFAGLNKCWCCFDRCYSFVDKRLISDWNANNQRIEETEEWMSGFSCWPLPILTITICAIELYYFTSLLTSPEEYMEELKNSTLIWHPSHRDEYHRYVQFSEKEVSHEKEAIIFYFHLRWFTYSFLHVGFSHFFINFLFQIALGLLIEFEHKVKIVFEKNN